MGEGEVEEERDIDSNVILHMLSVAIAIIQ